MKGFVINIFILFLFSPSSLPSLPSIGPFSPPPAQCSCKHFTKDMESVVIKDTM
jgi:hypothetical protein